MRFLRLLCVLLFPIFIGCSYQATHTEVNADFFKNPTDLQQRFNQVAILPQGATDGASKEQVFAVLGLKGHQLDSVETLGPDDTYKYMCGSPYNNCLEPGEFPQLLAIRIQYVDTTESVTINPSASATVHNRGHNQTIVAVFRNNHLIQPYTQGIAAMRLDETIYIMDIIGSTFKGALSAGTSFGVKSVIH